MKPSADPSKIGTLLCLFSALGYTAYNVCLRDASQHYDPSWINCVQSSVTVAVFGVYLGWQAARGRRVLPPRNELLALLIISLITQFGNILYVWAMSVVGVAVTSTLQTGVMLGASAILGLIVLGERVSARQVAAIVLITISMVFFSMGAQSPGETPASPWLSLTIPLGIGAAALAGISFALLTVGVRKTVTSNASPEAVVFLISTMGVVAMGPWCVYRLGVQTLLQTAPWDFAVMLAAGAMNLVAFLLVTKSLQMISVVRFNVLNNGLTTAMTAAIGVILFREPWNGPLLLAMLLAMGGILMISVAVRAE
jgi:drug/metabolite transporter (DMT)-like permease